MLNLESLPKHLAIIMDGNGRWANNQGRVKIDGYRKGSEVAFDIATLHSPGHTLLNFVCIFHGKLAQV